MDVNVKQLKEGDEKVFENIVSAFWMRMFKFASIYTLNEEVAKEITQDALCIFEKSRKEGLMNKEIAEELGLSVKTVEFHITKSLQQLRKELTSENFLMLFIFMSVYHP